LFSGGACKDQTHTGRIYLAEVLSRTGNAGRTYLAEVLSRVGNAVRTCLAEVLARIRHMRGGFV